MCNLPMEAYYMYTLSLKHSNGTDAYACDALLGISKLLKQGKLATTNDHIATADEILVYLVTVLNFDEAEPYMGVSGYRIEC